MKNILCVTVLLILTFCIFPRYVRAESLTHLDAVLVLDASGSMREADPHRLSYEAMMMFIDMLPVSGDRVAIVAYTDEIIASRELTLIDGQNEKDNLKEFIAGINVGGFTDITLGLLEAINLLEQTQSENQPVIILFTDGNNYLSPWNPRTNEDLNRDTEQIIIYARNRGITIYSIGLNFDGTLYYDYIKRFAYETGGRSFETVQPGDVLHIMSSIFYSQMDALDILAGVTQGDGEFWDNVIEIPEGTHEFNIIYISEHPLEVELLDPLNRPVPFDGNWAVFSHGNNYSVLKAIAPTPGNWTIRTRGETYDNIHIRVVLLSPDWATPEPVIDVEPIPAPDPAPPEPEQEPETEPEPSEPLPYNLIIMAAAGIIGVIVFIFIMIIIRKKSARVFTGRLVIEVTDHYAKEKSAPQYRNLIEYGRKTNLLALLQGGGNPILSNVIIKPSPTAPSHLPQLIIKCTSNNLVFKKDYMNHDASRGLVMEIRSEVRIEIPSENKSLSLRYME